MKIGLRLNPEKSQLINVKNGILAEDNLQLSDGSVIESVKSDEKIKYLGCSFNSELIFAHSFIETLNTNLDKLASSPLLKPDQKLNVINQYVFPTLVYQMQAAPIMKIQNTEVRHRRFGHYDSKNGRSDHWAAATNNRFHVLLIKETTRPWLI